MSETIQELYAATKLELEELQRKNLAQSQKVDGLTAGAELILNVHKARMEEYAASVEEAKAMVGILSEQERDELIREVEADRAAAEKAHKEAYEKTQGEIKTEIEALNALRGEVRETRGRIALHERILKRRGVV